MNKQYYHEMMKRDRLIPIIKGNKLIGLITYYIGDNNIDKYVRNDPWTILDDEPTTGEICYIDQMITNKNIENITYSWQVLRMMLRYINEKYPQVKYVRWNRHKQGESRVYHTSIRRQTI